MAGVAALMESKERSFRCRANLPVHEFPLTNSFPYLNFDKYFETLRLKNGSALTALCRRGEPLCSSVCVVLQRRALGTLFLLFLWPQKNVAEQQKQKPRSCSSFVKFQASVVPFPTPPPSLPVRFVVCWICLHECAFVDLFRRVYPTREQTVERGCS